MPNNNYYRATTTDHAKIYQSLQQEQEFYNKAYSALDRPGGVLVVKSIRNDERSFLASHLSSLIDTSFRPDLRIKPEYTHKVNKDGVVPRGKQQYPQQIISNGFRYRLKDLFSKKNSHSIASKQHDFFPPVFGWNTGRSEALTGLMYFVEDIDLKSINLNAVAPDNLPLLLPSLIQKYDGGTYGAPYKKYNELSAKKYDQENRFDPVTNKEGKIFSSCEQLLENGDPKKYNEVLMRARWDPYDCRCQLGIFSDNLKSRLQAQLRAIDFKVNFNVGFVPVSFYSPNKDPKYSPYMLQQQQQDLKDALNHSDPEICGMARVIAVCNQNTIFNGDVPGKEMQTILNLLSGGKVTEKTKKIILQRFPKFAATEDFLSAIEETSYDYRKIQRLIAQGANINSKNKQGETVLMIEARRGDFRFMQWLLANGADIDAMNNDGETALMIAARERNYQTMALLLAKGADIGGLDNYANLFYETNQKVVDYFLQHSTNNIVINKLFFYAVKNNNLIILNKILQTPGCLNKLDANFAINQRSVLMVAIKNGLNDVVEQLLANGANINTQNSLGETALMLAIETKKPDIINALLASGANIKSKDQYGNTALIRAIQYKQPALAQILLQRGADINDIYKDFNGNENTALSLAILGYNQTLDLQTKKNYAELIYKIIEKQKNIPVHMLNQQNNQGKTAFMIAVENGNTEIVRKLIDTNGVDLNIQNNQSKTALMIAIENGNTEIVKKLIDTNGVDLNLQNSKGKTALVMAIEKGNTEIIKILSNAEKIDLNLKDSSNNTALMIAVKELVTQRKPGDTEIIKILIEKGADINIKNELKQTVLDVLLQDERKHYRAAAQLQEPENPDNDYSKKIKEKYAIAEMLIKAEFGVARGSDNSLSESQQHALQSIINTQDVKLIKILIQNKVEFDLDDLQDKDGNNLLMLAIKSRDYNLAKYCVDKGASLFNKNRHGDTALMLAINDHKHTSSKEIFKLLIGKLNRKEKGDKILLKQALEVARKLEKEAEKGKRDLNVIQ